MKRARSQSNLLSYVAKEEETNGTKRARKSSVVLLIDDGLAQVPYEASFLPRPLADTFFHSILAETPWSTEIIRRGTKAIVTPRLVAAFSDPGVTLKYISLSRTGAPWTPTLLAIKARVEAYCGTTFNYCFLNLYRNGNDMIGWHSDDTRTLVPGSAIAAVTLSPDGGERDLLFRRKDTHVRAAKALLAHGSLYVMRGETQTHYQHSIPRRPGVTQPRINLTFRSVCPPASF